MSWNSRRIAYYLGAVVATTAVFTLAYNAGMSALENRPQPLYQSLEVVVQTFTTTGYGEDAPWRTLEMNALMIGMQIAGIGLILTAVDVFAVPWIQNALSVEPPAERRDLTDHVIICGHSSRGEAFISELDSRDTDYVLIEPDEAAATDLHEAGYAVVNGDPEESAALERAGIDQAMAVVADAADDTNASIVLSARDVAPEIRVVTLVEDEDLAQYHYAAGADDVLPPRQLLGETLAKQVSTDVSTAVDEGIPMGDDFELVELSVQEGSHLCGQTYGDARIHERFGVDVVGIWTDGEFEMSPPAETRLDDGTTLLVAGAPAQLDDLQDVTGSTIHTLAPQDVVIAGYGQAGSAAYQALQDANFQLTVLDVEENDDVDVVGDARDPAVLREAGIEDASVLLLTLGDDTIATFTALIARELNPDLEILVRANDHENTEKLYQASADYVQSLASVSGRMMASTVFDDEKLLAYDKRIQVVKIPVGEVSGAPIAEAERQVADCTVLAVVTDGKTVTDSDAETVRLGDADAVIVAGEADDIDEFERQFG